jgi:broad specificity phosphatase PhoE
MDIAAPEPLRTRLLLLCRGPVDWTLAEAGDPPLHADAAADVALAAAGLPQFDAIVASPQRASLDTATAIAAARPSALYERDDLDEVRTATPLGGAAARDEWLDRLYESYTTSADGESLAEGVARLGAALRAVGDRFYGRTTLVVSHPVVLSAFRASLLQVAASREQVDALPDLALSVVDYLEGRFYLVEDFPMRFAP